MINIDDLTDSDLDQQIEDARFDVDNAEYGTGDYNTAAAEIVVALKEKRRRERDKMKSIYANINGKCECWKCELKKTCQYVDKYQSLPETEPGALGLCKKIKEVK